MGKDLKQSFFKPENKSQQLRRGIVKIDGHERFLLKILKEF